MKWLTFKVQQDPGFRLNLADLLFIALLVSLALGLRAAMPELSLYAIPLYVGGTFFLFCNVFRIGNRAEIFWYVPFAATAAIALHTMRLEEFWWAVLIFFEPLKWLLIIRAIRRKPYKGIFYKFVQRKSSAPANATQVKQ